MPTTRLTAVKSTSGSDENALPQRESASEERKARFDSRKKRVPPTDPTPKQRIMIQFLNAIIK